MAESARRKPVDPTVYPVSEQVPESTLHGEVVRLLHALVRRWLHERGEHAFAGSDQFIYFRQHQPTTRVAPDVYVLPGVAADADFGAWKTWESGVVPSLAVEVVSRDPRKDYEDAPPRYDELGVQELIVFDPKRSGDVEDAGPSGWRVRFQVWRRRRGKLERVRATDGDRVRSAVLDCWLRAVGEGPKVRLRLGTGPRGETLLPTDAEAAEAAEAGRDMERAAREAAEAELARLRDELRRRGGT